MTGCATRLVISVVVIVYTGLVSIFTVKANTPQTVNIGILVDRYDDLSGSINRSVELAMQASNSTKYPIKMNPVVKETDLMDTFKLRQTYCALVDHQTISLLGSSKSSSFNAIQSYSRVLKIPFFLRTLSRESIMETNNYIINMCPSFIGAVIDFIKYNQWDRIFYLFDSDDALWRLQKLYQAFAPVKDGGHQFLVDAIRIPDVSNCREVLRKLDRHYNFDTKRIVVDLSQLSAYDTFMSQIIDVGMNRDGYHYLLGTLDIKGMSPDLWKSFTHGGVNITGFQLISKTRWTSGNIHRLLTEILGDGQPTVEFALTVDSVAVLTTALIRLYSNETARKIVFPFRRGKVSYGMNCSTISHFKPGPLVHKAIKEVQANGLSGKILFDNYGYRKRYKLDIHHLSHRSPLDKVGYWEDGIGLRTSLPNLTLITPEPPPANRTRLITTIENPPFIMVRESDKSDNGIPRVANDQFAGFCIDMIKEIAERLNFTYKIQLVKDGSYGAVDNGSWNGMIGELIRKEADMALASLSITRDREQEVRFSKPFMNTGISIMIKKPEKSKPGIFSFMAPLSYRVWGCITCGFFGVSFILYMVGRFSPYEWQDGGDENGSAPSDNFSFVNTIWFSLGALMQQGPDIFPRSLSGRVLGSVWWFFTLIMISSYTANLAAFLTFEKLQPSINSVDELAKQTAIKYGCQVTGSTFSFFKKSKVPVYQKMYYFMKEVQPSVFARSSEEGWKRVVSSKGKYSFLLESSNNDYYNQRKPCKTMKVGRNLDQKGYGIATPKGSDLSRQLNIAVLEMREYGELFKLEQKWWYNKGECGQGSGDKGKSALNLSNVSGIFHILIAGLVLAMIISLSQVVFHSKIKSKSSRRHCGYDVSMEPESVGNSPRRVTIETTPRLMCTESNGREPHLIAFDSHSVDDTVTVERHPDT